MRASEGATMRTGRFVAVAAAMASLLAAPTGGAATSAAGAASGGTAADTADACSLPADLAARIDSALDRGGKARAGGEPPGAEADGAERPTRVVLLVGDGVGAGYWTAARLERPDLAAFGLPVTGFTDTRNARGRITDSAASGTALATGC